MRANLENLEKIRKVITKRSQLKKNHWKFLKEKSLKAYKKRKNYESKFYKKEKKGYLIAYIHELFRIIRSSGKL